MTYKFGRLFCPAPENGIRASRSLELENFSLKLRISGKIQFCHTITVCCSNIIKQIKNIKQRLYLTRSMQIAGITSLLLCVLTMFLIYVHQHNMAVWIFGFALILLIISLALLIKEIQISAQALQYHIADIEEHLEKN